MHIATDCEQKIVSLSNSRNTNLMFPLDLLEAAISNNERDWCFIGNNP